jgi:ABC-2 type transport system ATP-binding protein
MIKIENLVKNFDDVKAVNNISLEIKSGEIVGLLGPNGAGKTTTLRLITGFLAPDSGKIVINGIDMTEDPTEAQKHIGYLPENNPLYKEMLVADFLNFSAELKQIPESGKKKALDFAVSAVAIGNVFYKPIRELSKGYKQRVGFAAALLHKPKIVILDEPTEGLDPNQRTEIRDLIKELSKSHTIVMSTHVLQEASAICNRILIINRGELVADGTPNELSKKGQNNRKIHLEIEGTHVKEKIKEIEGLLDSSFVQEHGGKYKIELTTEKTVKLQPVISELARKHNWTIWNMSEEEVKLEQIFQELTH